jgi:hypothetical protein
MAYQTEVELKAEKLYYDIHYRICNDNGMSENESNIFCAKQIAQLLCDELVKENSKDAATYFKGRVAFWNEVKDEIESLVV